MSECTRAHDGVTAATRVVERETPSEERNERTREETKEREVKPLLRGLSRRLSATTRGVNTTIVVIQFSLSPTLLYPISPTPPFPFPSHLLRRTPLIQSFSCAPLENRTLQRRGLSCSVSLETSRPRNNQDTTGLTRFSKKL